MQKTKYFKMSSQIIENQSYKKLSKTEEMLIGHIFELAYLTKKMTGKTICLGDFYGDPTCALINDDQNWCLVGGSKLIFWKEGKIEEIKDKNLGWIESIRQIDQEKVEIFTDSDNSNLCVWEFDHMTKALRKQSS